MMTEFTAETQRAQRRNMIGRGRIAVLIIVILAVLVMAGGVQAGKVSSTVLTAERAADALRAAAVYLDETGSEPLDVEVYDPDGQDGLWVVVVTE